MMTSIDGKIEGDFIHDHNEELGDWFELQKLEDTDAWGNGSNTHEKYFSDASIDLSPYAEAERSILASLKYRPFALCRSRIPDGRPCAAETVALHRIVRHERESIVERRFFGVSRRCPQSGARCYDPKRPS